MSDDEDDQTPLLENNFHSCQRQGCDHNIDVEVSTIAPSLSLYRVRQQSCRMDADNVLSSQSMQMLDERTSMADPSILRATNFSHVVVNFGRLLEPTGTIAFSGGSMAAEDTYALSHPVEELDFFLSHSWRDPPKLKWLSLLVHGNLTRSVLISNMTAALSSGFCIAFPSLYPLRGVPMDAVDLTVRYRYGPACMVFNVTLIVCLLFGHKVNVNNPTLFLDKVCIHQTNSELKSMGIKSLGGFLKHSKRMLVLWGDDYFDRLWCCYELAVYVLIQGTSHVSIMPVDYAAVMSAVVLNNLLLGVSNVLADAGSMFVFGDRFHMYVGRHCRPWILQSEMVSGSAEAKGYVQALRHSRGVVLLLPSES